ncbi:MAG TPA: inositol monophosphatase [Polyangia bacterium]|nr:inositol monophosphatase [Polyangia bacterium]
MTSFRDEAGLLACLREIHDDIRDEVVAACARSSADEMAAPTGKQAGDEVYAVDRVSERVLLDRFARLAAEWPCLLIAEGLGEDGRRLLPSGIEERDAEIVVIVDPIDGTRGLMYQKRSAWILTGVAPRPRAGPATLADVRLALQTEIPILKQHLSDSVWAVAGQGAQGERFNRLDGTRAPLALRPSRATTVAHGFGGLAKFFAGTRSTLADIDDAVIGRLLARGGDSEALVFDDQYISTGGQLYELMAGHDRFAADVRPLLVPGLRAAGAPTPLCAHPYDLATELVAREAGVVVTDPAGDRLRAPLDVTTDVPWLGFANPQLAASVGEALRAELRARGLLSTVTR